MDKLAEKYAGKVNFLLINLESADLRPSVMMYITLSII